LKIYKSSVYNEDFKKELQLISKLKNPNIVNFIGFIAEKSQLGIIFEFCENGNLKNFLKNEKNLTWKRKLNILIGISKGMELD